MQVERSGEQAGAPGRGAVLPHSFDRALIDTRIADQPQVVIRGQHKHLMPLGLHPRTGAAFERDLEWVNTSFASAAHQIENASRGGVDEAILLETPLLFGPEEAIKLFARCGREASTEV